MFYQEKKMNIHIKINFNKRSILGITKTKYFNITPLKLGFGSGENSL